MIFLDMFYSRPCGENIGAESLDEDALIYSSFRTATNIKTLGTGVSTYQ